MDYEYEYTEKMTARAEKSRKVFTPSQLNRAIRTMLESSYANIWVEGEISNFKHHSSGHMYLCVKDEKAQISAVFFAGQNSRLKFEVKDGLQVMIYGRISVYEPRGQYQLYIERMEPKGMGALQLAFLQMKEKLEKEGLFDPKHKKEIPRFPRCVGVVTSATGAAFQDILNVVSRRFSGTAILLNPVQVQGEGAARQIAKAIQQFNEYGEIDVMIVGRGGGSMEDLWAFNEEIVARAVFASKIPVISAVGHEIDWTICDLVADLRAPTPSAAAELVVQNREELVRRLQDYKMRMRSQAFEIISERREQLQALTESYAFKQPGALIEQFSQHLDETMRHMQSYLRAFMTSRKQEFQTFAGRLNALSPLAILERGYSVSFSGDGRLLKDVRKLKKGDRITTRFWKGSVVSEVKEITAEENPVG